MEDPDSLPVFLQLLPYLIALVVLLLLSALVSGAETSFFSIKAFDLEKMKKENKGESIRKLLQNPKDLLATILVANTFINITIVIISTYVTSILLKDMSGWLRYFIEIGVVTFLILLFGEILPKVYANRNAVGFAKFMAKPLIFLQKLLFPISIILVKSTNIVERKLKKENINYSIDQLSQVLELSDNDETTDDDRKIFDGIKSFGETEAKQIMHPRIDIFALEDTMPYQEVLKEVSKHGYSRIPVYHDNADNILGILFAKDLLPHLQKNEFDWLSLLRPPFFVPENIKLDDLLKDFQEKKTHLAVVVDEYGGTSGIITLEDVIEEIVGEITDEYDLEEHNFHKIDKNTYEFEGKIPLKDFYKIINISEEDEGLFEQKKGEAESLAGFFLEQYGGFPNKNDKIKIGHYELTTTSMDGKRIKKIKVEKK